MGTAPAAPLESNAACRYKTPIDHAGEARRFDHAGNAPAILERVG